MVNKKKDCSKGLRRLALFQPGEPPPQRAYAPKISSSPWSAETEKKLVQERLNHEEQLVHLGHHLLEYQPRQEAK